MRRLFVVEFDCSDMKKFYVCRFCSTPFARNTGAERRKTLLSNVVEGAIVQFSYLRTISNVEFFDIKPDCAMGAVHVVGQQICCIFCNNKVGAKLMEHRHTFLVACAYLLVSERTLVRINGENPSRRTVSPEERFNSPWPLLANDQ